MAFPDGSSGSRTPHSNSGTSTPSRKKTRLPVSKQAASGYNDDPAMYLDAAWRMWPEITIALDNLPTNVTTENLWDWFSTEGNIAYIDIFDKYHCPGIMSAKIRFEPPPKRAFWAKRMYFVRHPDTRSYPKGLTVGISVAGTPTGYINSPVCSERKFPIKITLEPTSMDIGTLIGPTSMNIMRPFSSKKDGTLKMEVNLKLRRITVFFPVKVEMESGYQVREHKLLIDFSQLKKIYQMVNDRGGCTLALPLRVPPPYYWKSNDIKSSMTSGAKRWDQKESWHRATNITRRVDLALKYPVAIHVDLPDPGLVDIGRWTCFRFCLSGDTEEARATNKLFQDALHDFNIQFEEGINFQVEKGEKPALWGHLDHPKIETDTGALGLLAMSAKEMVHLPFKVRYQLEVCISCGILNEHNISVDFLRQLAKMKPDKARLRLEFLADHGEVVFDPMSIFRNKEAEAYHYNPRVPHYCVMVRKALVTPTTVRFHSPTMETSNRVMRKYRHMDDRFLRVQFTGESEKGRITDWDQNQEIWKRISRTLRQGIRIGDRTYEFLAFGSSQLRQYGAYFFCPTDHLSCDNIRKWMGRFEHIKVIAKYAARLGQCFSTTREIQQISVPTIRDAKDVERNDYCFTDGVGIMSPFVSRLVIEEMDLDVFDQPSAFQFRMGGCKGVLAVWSSMAKHKEVYIRDSQKKFEAEYNGLEIVRCARFANATLNRQTILILESLGVPESAFLNLLDHQLRAYEDAMENNHTAIDLLTKFIDENQTTLVMAELLKHGFKTETTQEPFVTNILNLWRSWSVKLLKEKARIQVEKSAFVLGCVDETGTLRGHSKKTEDSKEKDIQTLPQIFLQITDSKQYNKTHIVRGVCIIGRNPSLHPGDIRVVQAIDSPNLHHLKDVVVFPKNGDRPVPNMLSGGDLDGDDFFVMWDPNLLPATWNFPPMNYTGSKPRQLDRDVNVEDLKDFFVKYMQNDVLGQIATAHLGLADKLGPQNLQCLRLAELHSNAVDYAKTGEPVEWKSSYAPRKWPHFMDNKKTTYHSQKALGKIYDKVVNKVIQFNPIWDNPFDKRITKRFTLENDMLKDARKIKSEYDTSVRRLLSQHDLKTEFELWTAFAMTKPAIGTDYKQQEDLGHDYDALKHRFRETCYKAAGGQNREQIDPFVAAMYVVTEEEVKIALYEHNRGPINDGGVIQPPRRLDARSMPLISFPWIFHWVLIRIALAGKYNPETSMLAAARRKVGLKSGTTPKKGAQDGEETQQATSEGEVRPSEPAAEMFTRLSDGSVLHRGEPLVLFHEADNDAVESVDLDNNTQGESDSAPSQTHATRQEGSSGEESDDDAMDRLEKLMGEA